MNATKMLLAAAVMLAPTVVLAGPPSYQSAGHCAGCGTPAPSCGCDDVVHCTTCAPRCGCGLIPGLLRGVDRVLTGLFSPCRPACCPTGPGCVDACGCGGGYDVMDGGYGPGADVMLDPFQDDPIQPQAAYPARGRSYRTAPAHSHGRSRMSRSHSHRPHRTAAAPPRPTPQPARRRAEVVQTSRIPEAAATKPRILKVEYAKPIAEPSGAGARAASEPRSLVERAAAAKPLRPLPANNIRVGAGNSSGVPVNPLR